MAGWSDKAKSGGGSTTEGTIVDYEFMDRFPFADDDDDEESPKGRKGKKPAGGDSIFMLLTLRPDGADADDDDALVKKSLYLGSSKFLVIEEDGKVLKAGEDGEVNEDGVPKLFDQGEVFKFIASLEEAGFPASARFPDPTEDKVLDFRAMIGWRIRTVNEVDVELTKRLGKQKGKGKNKGKEFNRTYLKVTKVFGEDEAEAPRSAPKKATAAKGKDAAAPKGKGKPAADEDDEEDEDEDEEASVTPKAADKVLKAILAAEKGGKIAKADLALKVTRYCAKNSIEAGERDAIRRMFADDDYFEGAAERGVIEEYNASAKKPMVVAA